MRYFAPPTGQYRIMLITNLGMGDAESKDRAAAHAAAYEMGALEVEMLEQAFPLGDVVRPGDALDAAVRLPGLAPVENDAPVFSAGDREGLILAYTPCVFHLSGSHRARRRVHQQRRAVADDLVVRLDAVDECSGHVSRPDLPARAHIVDEGAESIQAQLRRIA